ncbi:NACHT domain-containing protein [Bradyrhizobium pachyrhizi]|uniref:NACHT domain-containing protein n=1 Tax=Bradyrhizobium pachyrhizi TaxID=280333 RepID=A0A844T311_9BRAD|nr:NACHT domain-containing protein [Bradyrhizobium pachyrhizi]MVT69461.1 NACHT domain-containing protein [Bradyrhizobium pachyrhizi]
MTGDEFRDHIAALLRIRYERVQTEVKIAAKKADIRFEIQAGPKRRTRVAAECKRWGRALTRDHVKDILADYDPAFQNKEIDEIWIICDQTPAPGAREFAEAYRHCQLMTGMECEQEIVDFRPMITSLIESYKIDPISKYYIPPSFYIADEEKADLHSHIEKWLADQEAGPIAIWAGYGMGKTSYSKFLASVLAQNCCDDYAARIPILISLGEFTTAPDLETLITAQLTNHYGVRFFSTAAFRLLNAHHRFVIILDGFDEMKFAMAPNDFNHISAQIRKTAAVDSKLLLLGRPDSIESEEEVSRLTSSRLHTIPLKADSGPDFQSLRMAFLSKEEYLTLIRNFLATATDTKARRKPLDQLIETVASLDLGDILSRPVQAKMLAEVAADPDADLSAISRFTLYELFIRSILRREEEKAARKHVGTSQRIHFMRLLAWWLWTVKKTRTFAANEIPLDIVQQFQIPNVSLEGLRRELLIGSVLEEKNVGHFLAEKDAGIFYFPHTSFTEFLVADYIMSADFLSLDVAKLPDALYGEVPTFLQEHPSKDAIFTIYNRMKIARIAMTTGCIQVLLNDFKTRLHVELTKPESADPWDVCLRYFMLHAEGRPVDARKFLFACLDAGSPTTELAAIYCIMYEDALSGQSADSAIARMVLHIFRRVGFSDLFSALERGETTARSSNLNHLAEIVTNSIKLTRGANIVFDLSGFSSVALNFIGAACSVRDVIERIAKTFNVPDNNLLASTTDTAERALVSDLARREGTIRIIPTISPPAQDV